MFPWRKVVETYGDRASFVGTEKEWRDFCFSFGNVARIPTKTMLDLARVIAGAKMFIGNQSAPAAIAEGLKKPLILETCLMMPNTRFRRTDAQYVAGERIKLHQG